MLWLWNSWTQRQPEGEPQWLRPRLSPVTVLWLWPVLLVAMMLLATEGQAFFAWVAHMYAGGTASHGQP
jgi:hypothetical protein